MLQRHGVISTLDWHHRTETGILPSAASSICGVTSLPSRWYRSPPCKGAPMVLNVAPVGLSRYFQKIREFPTLTPEDELSLAHRWRDTEDMNAAQQLVTSHLRLVVKIALGYRGYGLPDGE